MTTTTDERKKARSVPLLDPNEYAEQTLERLEAERLTISNRLSGLRTQVKRAIEKRNKAGRESAQHRIDQLELLRDGLLKTAIAAKRTELAASASDLVDDLRQTARGERPSEAAMREADEEDATPPADEPPAPDADSTKPDDKSVRGPRDDASGTVDLAIIGAGKVWHVLKAERHIEETDSRAASVHGVARCGAENELINVARGVDARAERHAGLNVCQRCRKNAPVAAKA